MDFLTHEIKDDDNPIGIASWSLTNANKNYSHIDKEEGSAVVFRVTKFRKYLLL